jgi:hypothetical protein
MNLGPSLAGFYDSGRMNSSRQPQFNGGGRFEDGSWPPSTLGAAVGIGT